MWVGVRGNRRGPGELSAQGVSARLNDTDENPLVDETTKRISTMKDITLKTEQDITFKTEEALLACDVSDEALEGAAREQATFTLGSCTGLSECPA
jgi:hypothetical protein